MKFSLSLSLSLFRFVTQIKDQTDLVEMQPTTFECQLAPVGDPNMKVEWFLNKKPLAHSKYINFIPVNEITIPVSYTHLTLPTIYSV